jgi:hypothetical protein
MSTGHHHWRIRLRGLFLGNKTGKYRMISILRRQWDFNLEKKISMVISIRWKPPNALVVHPSGAILPSYRPSLSGPFQFWPLLLHLRYLQQLGEAIDGSSQGLHNIPWRKAAPNRNGGWGARDPDKSSFAVWIVVETRYMSLTA